MAHAAVYIASVKWTIKGNVILTAGQNIFQLQLTKAAPNIQIHALAILSETLDDIVSSKSIRSNIKWSKVTLNGIPTGKTEEISEVYTPEQCHQALAMDIFCPYSHPETQLDLQT